MTNIEPNLKPTVAPLNKVEGLDADYTRPLTFAVTEFALVTGCVLAVTLAIRYAYRTDILIYAAASIVVIFYLILLNKRNENDRERAKKQKDNKIKAELYSSMFGNITGEESMDSSDASINMMRERAIRYCQELIDDYKKVRVTSRNTYYIFQISTIIFSGVTPILVLLDKIEAAAGWVRWLPVIFPAIASIVTSVSTSFPFQENWVSANVVVELLEAEQEKFILGVSPAYRFYDLVDPSKRRRKVQESVESFIKQVNQIHLKQIQQSNEDAVDTKKEEEKAETTTQ